MPDARENTLNQFCRVAICRFDSALFSSQSSSWAYHSITKITRTKPKWKSTGTLVHRRRWCDLWAENGQHMQTGVPRDNSSSSILIKLIYFVAQMMWTSLFQHVISYARFDVKIRFRQCQFQYVHLFSAVFFLFSCRVTTVGRLATSSLSLWE